MKKIIILSMLLLQTIPALVAQNRADSSKIELKGLSPSEIRRQFLNLGETSEVYSMAFESRKANRQSIRSFVVGGLFVAGGIYGLVEASNRPKGLAPFSERFAANLLAVMSLGLSIPLIMRAVNKKKTAKSYLNDAIRSYNEN